MAITKEKVIAEVGVQNNGNINVAVDTVIKEDGVEISKTRHRHVVTPYVSTFTVDSDDKKTWTHTDSDISSEDSYIQSIANVAWTDQIKANYKAYMESM